MGDVASVFEAIAARCPQEGSPIWPDNFNDQQNRVVRTRREFGLDWQYANSCPVSNHSNLEIAPDQTAALRDATVITIPNGTATTFHHKVQEFFSSGQASDLSIPGTSLCPFCAAGLSQTLCDWTLLPWTEHTPPNRVFFRSPEVFRGLHGRPMSPSPTLSMGAALGGNQTTVITPTTAALRAGIINAGRNIRDEVHHPVGTVLSTTALQRMPRMPTAALRAGIINAGRNIRHKALQDEVHHPVETVLSTIALQRMPGMPS